MIFYYYSLVFLVFKNIKGDDFESPTLMDTPLKPLGRFEMIIHLIVGELLGHHLSDEKAHLPH